MKRNPDGTFTSKKRTRRTPVVKLVVYEPHTSGIHELTEKFPGVFTSEGAAIAAAAADPEYCENNDVRAIRISPRIVPKTYKPRTPKMVFENV